MAELIVALDVPSTAEAVEKVETLGDSVSFYKIGMELFTAEGPEVVKAVKERGKKVFLDLKFHDIPRTVQRAVTSAAALGVDLLTIHAAGGRAMIRAAKDAAVKAAQEKLDQARKDAFDKYADWQKAQHDLSAAEEKAELAARDYLNALKTGDPEIIAAYKERLQEANDALLEAKRNEEAAQQGLNEAGANVARAQAELDNAAK